MSELEGIGVRETQVALIEECTLCVCPFQQRLVCYTPRAISPCGILASIEGSDRHTSWQSVYPGNRADGSRPGLSRYDANVDVQANPVALHAAWSEIICLKKG